MSTACVSWTSSSQCVVVCIKCGVYWSVQRKWSRPLLKVSCLFCCVLFFICIVSAMQGRHRSVRRNGTWLVLHLYLNLCLNLHLFWLCRQPGQGMCSVRRNRSYPVLQALTALPRHTLVSWGLSPRSVHPVISDLVQMMSWDANSIELWPFCLMQGHIICKGVTVFP